MPIKHEQLDYKAARKYLPVIILLRVDFERDLLELIEAGDFWQNAKRYCGPLPAPGEGYLAGMEMLRKSFAPILKIRECLRRHVRGVIGREPQFESVLDGIEESKKERRKRENYTDSRSEIEALADEADDVQGDVWDERGEHKIAKATTQRLCATGKVFLRYDIPPGLLEPGTDVATGDEALGVAVDDWQEAYRLTHMELCARGSASVYKDPSTMRETAFYSYTEPDPLDEKRTRKCVQISWLQTHEHLENEDGSIQRGAKLDFPITRVRIVRDKGEADAWEVDTGGVLLVVAAEMEALVTPDLLQLQDIVCSIGTMVKINGDVAGFPQVNKLDVDKPAALVPNPANPSQPKRIEVELAVGPRTQTYEYSTVERDGDGKPLLNDDGKPMVRNGSIQYREPISSQPLRDDIEMFNTEIYSGFNQRHIQARTSANASAQMLVEMRSDYADSLLETKPDVERLLRSIFKGRLCMAADLAGDEAALKAFRAGRVRVDLNLNAGPLSAEERADILERYDKKLLSRETCMVLLGTEDVDSELLKLQKDAQSAMGDGAPPVAKASTPVLAGASDAE